jgi:hypothetical protein
MLGDLPQLERPAAEQRMPGRCDEEVVQGRGRFVHDCLGIRNIWPRFQSKPHVRLAAGYPFIDIVAGIDDAQLHLRIPSLKATQGPADLFRQHT